MNINRNEGIRKIYNLICKIKISSGVGWIATLPSSEQAKKIKIKSLRSSNLSIPYNWKKMSRRLNLILKFQWKKESTMKKVLDLPGIKVGTSLL